MARRAVETAKNLMSKGSTPRTFSPVSSRSDVALAQKLANGRYKPAKSGSTSNPPSEQISNYQQKFATRGIDIDAEIDDRNAVEKFLNLRENQGFVGDAFELLDRPRNAVSNAYTSSDSSDEVLGNLFKGLTGEEYSEGRDILAKATGKDRDEFGFWANLGVELVTDPLNWIIPTGLVDDAVKGGTKMAFKSGDELLMGGIKKLGGKTVSPLAKKGFSMLPEAMQQAGKNLGESVTKGMSYSKSIPKNIYNKSKELLDLGSFTKRVTRDQLDNMIKKHGEEGLNKIGRMVAMDAGTKYDSVKFLKKITNNAKKGSPFFLLEDAPTESVIEMIDTLNSVYSSSADDLVFYLEKVGKEGSEATGWKVIFNPKASVRAESIADDIEMMSKLRKGELNAVIKATDNIAPQMMDDVAENLVDPAGKQISMFDPLQAGNVAPDLGAVANKATNVVGKTVFNDPLEKLAKMDVELPRLGLDFEETPELLAGKAELQQIIDQNRDFLEKAGIKVGNNKGYIHKMLNPNKLDPLDTLRDSGFLGSPASLQESLYEMSPWAVNRATGIEMFEPNVYNIMKHSIDTTVSQAQKIGVLKEALETTDTNIIEFVPRGNKDFDVLDAVNNRNKVIIKDIGDFKSKFDFISKNADLGDTLQKLEKGQMVVMDKNVYDLLTFDKNKKDGLEKVWKVYDKVMGYWKGSKLLSSGYHMRNYTGNVTNMVLAGVPVQEIFQIQAKAGKDLYKFENEIMSALSKGVDPSTFTGKTKALYDEFMEFIGAGLVSDSKVRSEMSEVAQEFAGKLKDKTILDKVMNKNYHFGQFVDDFNRLATWRWAKKNFQKVGLDSADEASDFVRYALFDYSDITQIESQYLKRLFPFYTFAKKNTAFQLENFLKTPRKYANMNRIVDDVQEEHGLTDENMPEYADEQMWIPIPFIGGKGNKVQMIKLNLPQTEAREMFEHPLQKLITSSTPLLKAPFELMANEKFFTGMPIEKFKGEEVEGNRLIKDPTMDYLADEFLGGITSKGTYVLDALEELMGRPIGRDTIPKEFNVAPSMTSVVDKEKAVLNKEYEKLREIEDYNLKYLQQGNERLPSITDVRKSKYKLKK